MHAPASSETGLLDRLGRVHAAIADACGRAGRDPGSVTLVAASKTVPADVIGQAIVAGQLAYGENRVQEAKGKWPQLRQQYPDTELHLIGPLQSNKVREAVAFFDVIQSLDRPSLCAAIAREHDRQGRQTRLFVQVNIGSEPQKSGILPDECDDFIKACRTEFGLDVAGAMCIPPVDQPPEPYFAALAGIAARNGLGLLSMGMSSDFEKGIEHGATHVRVGSAIFGARLTAH